MENADISKRFKCPSCSQYQSPEHLRNAPNIAEAVSNARSRSRVSRQMNASEDTNSPPKSDEYVICVNSRLNKKRALSPDRSLKANKSQKLDH